MVHPWYTPCTYSPVHLQTGCREAYTPGRVYHHVQGGIYHPGYTSLPVSLLVPSLLLPGITTFSPESRNLRKWSKDTRMVNDFEETVNIDRFDIPGFLLIPGFLPLFPGAI